MVAEVDLTTLAVSYHALHASASVFARLLDWLQPPAYAKGASGPTRSARWVGGGLLAVAGSDENLTEGPRGEEQTSIRGAGLSLIDTRDWTIRRIDRGATDVRVAGDVLLTTGSSWEPGAGEPKARGLVAYELDGRRRFRLFEGREVWIRHTDANRAYVDVAGSGSPESSFRVVDVHSGRAARGARAQRVPWLLLQPAYGRWDG